MSDIMINTPEGIEAFRLLAMKGRLSLEIKGIRFKGMTAFSYVKKVYGFKGNKQKVYDQYINLLKKKGVLKDDTDNKRSIITSG